MFPPVQAVTAPALGLLMYLIASQVMAQDSPPATGALDGLVFVGHIGTQDDPDFSEELHFNQGVMWSKNCISCGFQPAPYWTRQIDGMLHFVGELRGRSGSVFQYDGLIDRGAAEVSVRWTKSRWYWKIDRTLVFRGSLAVDRPASSAAQASAAADAALSGPDPDWCP